MMPTMLSILYACPPYDTKIIYLLLSRDAMLLYAIYMPVQAYVFDHTLIVILSTEQYHHYIS